MSAHDSAFPSHGSMGEVVCHGLTKREYFAGLAMQACIQSCAQDEREHGEYPEQMFARKAVDCADALIAALAKEPTP